jgi:hypothetical protein
VEIRSVSCDIEGKYADPVEAVYDALIKAIDESRFTVRFITKRGKRVKHLKLHEIRLRDKKAYCGNHPAACEIGGGSHRKGPWLEGADWVEFNDLVNDVLDGLHISANVHTAVCIVRKGKRRRIRYGYFRHFNQTQWERDEDEDGYEDYLGTWAPNSIFPMGTPGLYLRNGVNYNVVG